MNQLRDAMRDLADTAPPALAAPDLWTRGVRRRRRRRAPAAAGGLAVLALVAGVALQVPAALDEPAPPPASDLADARLPEWVFDPSETTEGTDDLGAPGRIAVALPGEAGAKSLFSGPTDGMIAVSALDGSYRFLQVDGLMDSVGLQAADTAALSPDGRYLAFPVRQDVPGLDDTSAAGVVEWRVYDAETGDVLVHAVPDAPHGTEAKAPVWTPDSTTVVLPRCVLLRQPDDETTSCRSVDSELWDVEADRAVLAEGVLPDSVVGDDGTRLVVRDGRSLSALDARTGELSLLGRPDLSAYSEVGLLNLDGEALTVAGQPAAAEEDVDWTVTVSGSGVLGGAVPARPLDLEPDTGFAVGLDVLGPGELALLHRSGDGPHDIRLHDPRRGTFDSVVSFDEGTHPEGGLVATDLLDRPTRPASSEPEAPADLRRAVVVSSAALLGAGAAVWLALRRRRTPRPGGSA